ncbi:MAG: PolC-type DNA polymerase III [Clostridia bacterium]|nr:PolC-type DNA polymerase III [Clostridia bacterium]
MSNLLAELAGAEFAAQYESVNVTGCRVKKEDMSMSVDVESDAFPCMLPFAKLRAAIREKFGVNKITFNVKYKNFTINSGNINAFFENVREYTCFKKPALLKVLAGSTAEFSENTLVISIRFGGDEILVKENAESIIKEYVKRSFAIDIDIKFDVKIKEEEKLLEEIEETRKNIVTEIPVKIEEEEPPKKKEVIVKVENEEEKDANLIIGRDFSGEITSLADITEYSGKVIVAGKIIGTETRETRSGNHILSVYITDDTSSITCKCFVKPEKIKEVEGALKGAKAVTVKGDTVYDQYEHEVTVKINNMKLKEVKSRIDNAEIKRVELHAHTVMSAMDSVAKTDELIKTAAKWGHKAIAITDHGVVQAYPDAFDAGKKNEIKVIYGMEGYLMGDETKIVYNEKSMDLDGDFVVFDIETTGLKARFHELIEVAGVKVSGGKIVERFSEFVKPKTPISPHITELTRITNEMVSGADNAENVLKRFVEFAKGCVLVAHNANFDVGFLKRYAEKFGIEFDFCYVDTLGLSRKLVTNIKRHRLDRVAKALGIPFEGHHRAINDAEVTAKIFLVFVDSLKRKGIKDVLEINDELADETIKQYTDLYHVILLVKDMTGLQNLYKLVSTSHLDNFYRKPRISKEVLKAHREGIVVGSACEAGELYNAVLSGKTQQEIENIAEFYDYLEIQPLKNNEFMIRDNTVSSFDELKDVNKEIVMLGDKMGKPVVATCDVHFVNPEDAIFREVLMVSQEYEDAEFQPPLFLRTTEEMLAEFKYLGSKKAFEVVVENTNKIADMIEEIRPIPKDTYPPEMPGATEDIQRMSDERAHEIYGEVLPDIVKQRMEKELVPIIKYGFSVMYMIAQKLVTKSLSDGYLVGSRGSVGSSFIAYLIGITEINSLPPHYICPKCKNVEFITDGSVSCGADLDDKDCPACGHKYKKEGYDIPFETFLGFDGDKEPDIDLNFSGEYQSVAHKYTEELFGVGHVYRAGTIGTLAEKTAFGYLKKYAEFKGKSLNKAEEMRLAQGIVGVKRTTGQHPGGVMIVPKANEIYEFSPIQHPANDNETDIITTHFDYHSISGKLLKLDILGHDDPTMIRMLEDLTGLDAKTIPIDDKPTMSLFTTTEALGVTPEDLGTTVGTFAVPEFGTRFVQQMLIETKPTTFGELIRISGLSHGTDVWTNNAQELVRDGVATLPEVICTRDDIMLYLLLHNLPPLESFKIMEKVRKGKGLTPEDEALMRENNVPEWYISSCKKIKYMFPKAHAAAYVTMGFRIAYFKVHYPIAFYIAYYTVRATEFDADLMLRGRERVGAAMAELNALPNPTQKEKNLITILEVVNEMYARGIKLLPVDLYKSHATKFVEEDGAIRPPLNAINGVSDAVGQAIVDARECGGPFISSEDLMRRSKIGKSIIDKLKEYDVLTEIPDTNQITFFDF